MLEADLHLVLLDIMMPNMTGYEVCRRLRQTHSASRLPVVMLTAKNRVSDLVEGFKAGANDYVAKPFARNELSARVQNQIKLKQAYQTLAENIRLKKELAHRERTELDLRLMQRRLGLLLDAVDDAVIAVNEADEISFCNAAGKRLLGREPDELLGRTLGMLFDEASSDSLRALWAAPESGPADGAPSRVWWRLHLTGSDGARRPVRVIVPPLNLDAEQLQVLIMRPAADPDGEPNPPVAAVIDELNWHQSRLRGVEETLNGLLPRLMDRSPDVLTEIRAIDRALESVGKALITDQARDDRRQLAVTVMQLSVDYWREATGEDKFELARRSGLWKVYTNRDGWRRFHPLDRCLSHDAFPKRPAGAGSWTPPSMFCPPATNRRPDGTTWRRPRPGSAWPGPERIPLGSRFLVSGFLFYFLAMHPQEVAEISCFFTMLPNRSPKPVKQNSRGRNWAPVFLAHQSREHLSYDAFPKRPRWSWISDTAVHVPTTRDKVTPLRTAWNRPARFRFAKARAHSALPRPTPGGLPERPLST